MFPDAREVEDVSDDDAVGKGRPRRESDVTSYPSNNARRQTVWPKNPVPPNTSNLPLSPLLALLEDDSDDIITKDRGAPSSLNNEGERAHPCTTCEKDTVLVASSSTATKNAAIRDELRFRRFLLISSSCGMSM